MTKTVAEALKEAKSLIDTPEKWTQGAYARDAKGSGSVHEKSDEAVCFCSLGALFKATDDISNPIVDKAWSVLSKAVRQVAFPKVYTDVAGYNDNHTHAEVMAMWDKAIELAEADED